MLRSLSNLFISIGITAILVWSVITGISSSLWIPIIIHEASAIIVILNGARAGGNMKIRTVLNEIVKEMYTNFIEALNILVESFNNSPLQAEAQQVP